MNYKVIASAIILLFFFSCDYFKKQKTIDFKKELEAYLLDKKVSVKNIEAEFDAPGIYEVRDSQGTFYIDQNKNVIFGMIVNLDKGSNITLTKKRGETIHLNLEKGHLLPFLPKDLHTKETLGNTKQINLPQLRSAEEYDSVIRGLENAISRLKEQKKLVQP